MIVDGPPRTTAGVIALGNLEARIDGQTRREALGQLSVAERVDLVELIALHGQLRGRIGDSKRARDLAEELVLQAPNDDRSFLARARMAAVFHRFEQALSDLDVAEALGLDQPTLDTERAGVFQAVGRYAEALAIRRRAVADHPDFNALGALAGLYADLGAIAEGDRLFGEARRSYRSVSPFPLAVLEFQYSGMWMECGDLQRACSWCEAALRRVPAYVPAAGRLAELEAAAGERQGAIERLRLLAIASDDPDYAAQLARMLDESGLVDEAQTWRDRAETRFSELIASYAEAFAEHAAEFWLTIGADPERALRFARQNRKPRDPARPRTCREGLHRGRPQGMKRVK